MQWWPAEDYHQQYWDGEGHSGILCLAVIPPKLRKLRRASPIASRKARRLRAGSINVVVAGLGPASTHPRVQVARVPVRTAKPALSGTVDPASRG